MSSTFSSREFNQDTGRAKRAAFEGPVFITDRGRTAHVLLSIEDYRKITDKLGDLESGPEVAAKKSKKNIVELLAMPGSEKIDDDFEVPTLRAISLKPAEFDD